MNDDRLVPVYNPVDSDLKWKFNGIYYELKANDISAVPYRALDVLLVQLGALGVCAIPIGVPKEQVDKVIQAAEVKFWENRTKTNEEILISEAERAERRKKAGLKVEEPEEVKQARKWLEEHSKPPKEIA